MPKKNEKGIGMSLKNKTTVYCRLFQLLGYLAVAFSLLSFLPSAAQAQALLFSVPYQPALPSYIPPQVPPPQYQPMGCFPYIPSSSSYPLTGVSSQDVFDQNTPFVFNASYFGTNCFIEAIPPQVCLVEPDDGASNGSATCPLSYTMFMYDTGEEVPATADVPINWQCPLGQQYSADDGGCVPVSVSADAQNNGPNDADQGDPVNPATGNATQQIADFSGQGAFPLSVTRYFNSYSASQAASSAFFPSNWRLNYDRRLSLYTQNAGAQAVNAEREDGKILQFVQSTPNGPWVAQNNINARLVEQFDTAHNLSGWSYYSDHDDQIEQYDAQGRLSWIQNRAGLRQTMTRDPNGRLLTVTDPFGRQLQFAYELFGGLLQSVTLPAGGNITYSYASSSATYPASEVLSAVQYPDGHSISLLYNEAAHINGAYGRNILTGVIDENNNRYLTYDYNLGNNTGWLQYWVSRSTLGSGLNVTSFAYTLGYPLALPPTSTTVTDPNGAARVFQFNNSLGALSPSSVSQPAAGSTPAGTASTTFDANGNLASSSDFNGNLTCFQYDLTRNLQTVRVEGLPTGSSCPPDLSSYVVPSGAGATIRKISTQWHPTWRLPTVVAGPLLIETTAYDSTGNPSTISDQATTDTTGTLAFSATPTGAPRVRSMLSNANGQPIQVTGPRTDIAQVSTLSYYPSTTSTHQQGDLASTTNALGQTTTFDAYDGAGRLLQSTDANGLRTTVSYTPRGWVSSIVKTDTVSTSSSSETTVFSYDYAGNLIQTTFPDGSWVSQTFDDAHRLTGKANSAGESTSYTLDNAGNITQTQLFDSASALRYQETQTFDTLGKLISSTGLPGETTAYSYDAQGNMLSQTDALGNATNTSFDTLNRQSTTLMPSAASGGARPMVQAFLDLKDRLASLVDPRSLTTIRSVDGLGNETALQSPDAGSSSASYDAAGNKIGRVDARGISTSYAYDALDRRILASYQSGIASTFQYDGGVNPAPYSIGHLTSFADESGQSALAYDAFGHLTGLTQTTASSATPAATQTATWIYNEADSPPSSSKGHLVGMTLPGVGSADNANGLSYGYDSFGRVNSISFTQNPSSGALTTPIVSNIQWSPLGTPVSWTWGNGSVYSRQLDLDGRVSQYPLGVLAGSGSISGTPGALTRTVSYDLAGRVQSFTHADASGSTTSPAALAANQSFAHDGLSRVSGFTPSATAPSTVQVESYGYDVSGNRAAFGVGSNVYAFSTAPTSNQLAGISGAGSPQSFSYDANGNLLSDGVSAWTYSARGRMASSSNAASGGWSYYYTAVGDRSLKEGPSGQAIRFLNDQQGHLLGEFDASGNMIEEIVWLGDLPLAVIQPPAAGSAQVQVGYVFADQINAPRAVVRSTDNALLWDWSQTDPFGRVQPNDNPQGAGAYVFDLRLPGQIHDFETGLDHNNARDYGSSVGRYVQPDPIEVSPIRINPYAYTGNQPLFNVDSSGLAYFAYRPIDKDDDHDSKWSPPWFDPIPRFFNLSYSHEQLFYEDGRSPANIGFMGNSNGGAVIPDSEADLSRYVQIDPTHYNDCVMRLAESQTPHGVYNFFYNNCQTYAAELRAQYYALLSQPSTLVVCTH
jgi:RHS repeat-associated protein